MTVPYIVTHGFGDYGGTGSSSDTGNPYWDILQAVAGLLETVDDCPTPEVRQLAYKLGPDAPPLCWVCPADRGEKAGRHTFYKTFWSYPVLVLLIFGSNRIVGTSGLESRLQIRHDVEHALFNTALDEYTEVHDCDPDPRAAIDLQAALGANYVVSGFSMSYRVARTRAGRD